MSSDSRYYHMNADSWLNHALKFGSAWPEEQVAAIGIAILGSMAAFSSRRNDRCKTRTSCTSQYAPHKKRIWSMSDLFHVCFLVVGAMLSTTPTLSHARQQMACLVPSGMKTPPRVHAGNKHSWPEQEEQVRIRGDDLGLPAISQGQV